MADIKIACENCGSEMNVSEYAERVVCSNCGHSCSLIKAEEEQAANEERRRILKNRNEANAEGIPQSVSVNDILQQSFVPKKQSRSLGSFGKMTIVFVLVAGLALLFNYTNVLPDNIKLSLSFYMPYVLLILHFLIILAAFKDNVFDGILSLLVPPYAYYFLFIKSDEYVFKALYLGLLIGYGSDYLRFLLDTHDVFFRWVNSWMDGEY